MLASAPTPFYISGTFWTGAGALVGAVAIGVAVIIWRLGAPRRLVTYSTPIVTPLLSRYWPGMPSDRMQIIVEGEVLADPYVVVLRIDNKARRDVRSSDFDQRRPLAFNLGTEVLSVVTDGPLPEPLRMDLAGIALGPMLMPGRSQLGLTFITKGRPTVTCQSYLINILVKEKGTEKQRNRYFVTDVISTACLIASVLVMTIMTGLHAPARTAIAYPLIPVVVASFVVMQWASRKWKRTG